MSAFCIAVAVVTAAGLALVWATDRAVAGTRQADPDHTDYQARFEADERRGRDPQ